MARGAATGRTKWQATGGTSRKSEIGAATRVVSCQACSAVAGVAGREAAVTDWPSDWVPTGQTAMIDYD